MKKRRILRNASLVALSTVMLAGAAAAFAGCSGGSSDELSVFIFCSATDAETNQKICNDWAKKYSEEIGKDIKIKFNYKASTTEYTRELDNEFTSGNAPDVFYMSPKYVRLWKNLGRVLDISPYINASDKDKMNGIWQNALSFYGYTDAAGYNRGDRISYKTTSDGVSADGFYTEDNKQVGLYGLPKDYSSFSMAYNGKFLSDTMKKRLTTAKANDTRSVKGAYGNTANLTFTGAGNDDVVTYAVSGTYTNPYTNESVTVTKGQPAALINIGVPVTYKPYNFYRFKNIEDARKGGDPIVLATDEWAPDGYTVTIPGFPGETFEISDTDVAAKDANAPYDTDMGHVVLTYAEFGALTWALTYYCNTFDWDAAADADTTKGTGGITLKTGPINIYGCGQYEGDPGPTLYMLPWLAGNDADFISEDSTKAVNAGVTTDVSGLDTVAKMRAEVAKSQTETRKKLRLNGQYEDVAVQYGVNSERFIETYGAFLEFASTWNGNSENCGDDNSKNDNSWASFRAGNNIFYGGSSWDASTRNESDRELCDFHQFPMPVSEQYALYSEVKDAYYDVKEYGTKPGAPYTADQIKANQITRQDKWAARMDSVGYAVYAGLSEKADTDEEWKIAGAVSLVQELCVNEDAQLTLTYAGAQLPNFKQQAVEMLNYQSDEYKTDGAFKNMITPEGSATVTGAEGKALWDYYYGLVCEMDALAQSGSTQTVAEFMEGKKEPGGADAKYDPQYADTTFNNFTGEISKKAFAMKILYMTTFTKADRDLNMRMQYGVNGVRDSAMYTYNNNWILNITTRGGTSLAYIKQAPITGTTIDKLVLREASKALDKYQTAAVLCLKVAGQVETQLAAAIAAEQREIDNA